MSLLIQFVRGCNLWGQGGCSYCFYRKVIPEETTYMEVDLFEDIVKQYTQIYPHQQEINIHSMGGEPLLAGVGYFEKILAVERKFGGISFQNHLQTNATLITEEWAAFLKDNDIKIGVSMEALPELQNQFRCGTADVVLRGIKKLRAVGIPLSTISVINNTSLKHLLQGDNIKGHFEFFMREGICSWAYNLYISHDFADPERVNPNEYGSFLKKVIDTWLNLPPEPTVSIREVDDLLCIATGKKYLLGCTFSRGCAKYLTIGPYGEVTPCERLIGSRYENLFGNIKQNKGLIGVYKSAAYRNFLKQTQELPKQCLSCTLKKLCNDGCTAMRDTEGRFILCETIKRLSAYLKEVINNACTAQGST